MKSKRMERQKWIKNNSLMILRGSDSCKNINSTISMSYPDVVIACIEYKVSLGSIQSNWGSVGEAR